MTGRLLPIAPLLIYGGLIAATPIIALPSLRGLGGLVPLAAVLLAAVVGYRRVAAFGPALDRPLAATLAAGIALAAVSALWAIAPHEALVRAAKLALYGGCAVVLLGLVDTLPAARQRSLGTLAIGAFCVGLGLLLVELIGGHPLYRATRPALASIDPSVANRAAVTLALLTWPTLAALVALGRPRLALVLGGGVAATLLASASQSAALALGLGLLGAAAAAWAPRLSLVVLATGVAGLTLTALWSAPVLYAEAPSMVLDYRPASPAARLEMWDFTARQALQRPWFGWGLEASPVMPNFGETPDHVADARMIALHPHNGILQLWLELGLVGVLWALAAGAGLIRRLWRSADTPAGIAHLPWRIATVGTALSVIAVSHGVWQSWWLAVLIMTALWDRLAYRLRDG